MSSQALSVAICVLAIASKLTSSPNIKFASRSRTNLWPPRSPHRRRYPNRSRQHSQQRNHRSGLPSLPSPLRLLNNPFEMCSPPSLPPCLHLPDEELHPHASRRRTHRAHNRHLLRLRRHLPMLARILRLGQRHQQREVR